MSEFDKVRQAMLDLDDAHAALDRIEARVKELEDELAQTRESWYFPLPCAVCGRWRLLVRGRLVECEKCGADNDVLRYTQENEG